MTGLAFRALKKMILWTPTLGGLFGMELSLLSSINSPGMVGQVVTWTAAASGSSQNVRYRFRARNVDAGAGEFRIIRDFSPSATLDWTSIEREGNYEMEVTAKDLSTGETKTSVTPFHLLSRVSGDRAALSPAANPLVYLFSAPPCSAGDRMRVEFRAEGAVPMRTPYRDCVPGVSMNFYLAGLRPESTCAARAVLEKGGPAEEILFFTGERPQLSYELSLATDLPEGMMQSSPEGVILTSNGLATDLAGNPLWSAPHIVNNMTRPESGGYFWGVYSNPTGGHAGQGIRKFDLAGLTILETNAERVNEQLRAMGRREIAAFHHEVRTLPGGNIVALAAVEQLIKDAQGPGEVDVIGDMIIILDPQLRVVWTWDAFDWLDITRNAVLGEVCAGSGGGCTPQYLALLANDWTHSNSVQLTPDGDFLVSVRHQDWILKIRYANGDGDGHIVWRLGPGGDFTFTGDNGDPWPWFSHQHDASIDWSDPERLLVYDNGNTRWSETGEGYSRGQVLRIDEAQRTVSFELNAHLGWFSPAVGSAQKLANGNYHFNSGYVIEADQSLAGYSLEVDAAGQISYALRTGTMVYRSFRLPDLYSGALY